MPEPKPTHAHMILFSGSSLASSVSRVTRFEPRFEKWGENRVEVRVLAGRSPRLRTHSLLVCLCRLPLYIYKWHEVSILYKLVLAFLFPCRSIGRQALSPHPHTPHPLIRQAYSLQLLPPYTTHPPTQSGSCRSPALVSRPGSNTAHSHSVS